MNEIATWMSLPGFTIRPASQDDVPLIHAFIRGLARFERLEHECMATEEALRDTLFGPRAYAEVLIGDFGTAFLTHVADLAVVRGCGRLEWSVLDWNENAIRLYERLGAEPMNEWTTMRVTGEAFTALARVTDG